MRLGHDGNPTSDKAILRQFGAEAHAKAPVVHVQIGHKPQDRGMYFDLDAWTGEVMSQFRKVPIERW